MSDQTPKRRHPEHLRRDAFHMLRSATSFIANSNPTEDKLELAFDIIGEAQESLEKYQEARKHWVDAEDDHQMTEDH